MKVLIATVLIAAVLAIVVAGYRTYKGDEINAEEPVIVKVVPDQELIKWVYDKSSKISHKTCTNIVNDVMKSNKPLFLLAVIAVESEFNPTAVSSKGAIGLGQIMWEVWSKDLIKAGICKEKRDLFDPDINIKATDYVLDVCLKESGGDITKALSKYLGADQSYYKNRITENVTQLYLKNKGAIK